MRCLQKLPQDRFSSAQELGQALESIVAESNDSPDRLVARAVSGKASDEGDRPSLLRHIGPRRRRSPTVGLAFRGYLAALGLIVAGAVAIQYAAARTSESDARHKNTVLQLVPARTSHLRVVADPWATVIVDGQRVDTTPFAYAIPLSAGTHYVRLEHPKAPTERRTIRLTPGETVLLDVKMDVERPVAPPPEPAPAQSTDPSTP
jgi:serine/threonine-protein kinase